MWDCGVMGNNRISMEISMVWLDEYGGIDGEQK
jgi:hypothetical protein